MNNKNNNSNSILFLNKKKKYKVSKYFVCGMHLSDVFYLTTWSYISDTFHYANPALTFRERWSHDIQPERC